MRRTPEATALSPVTEIRPISPVRRTWVPPHNSTDQPSAFWPCSRACLPIDTTRTSSPYFSPNSARAPASRASSTPSGARGDLVILKHHVVGNILDAGEFFRRDRLRMHEVEAQPIRAPPASRAGRCGRRAPGAAPRAANASPSDAPDRRAPRVVHLQLQRGADLEVPCSTVP